MIKKMNIMSLYSILILVAKKPIRGILTTLISDQNAKKTKLYEMDPGPIAF